LAENQPKRISAPLEPKHFKKLFESIYIKVSPFGKGVLLSKSTASILNSQDSFFIWLVINLFIYLRAESWDMYGSLTVVNE